MMIVSSPQQQENFNDSPTRVTYIVSPAILWNMKDKHSGMNLKLAASPQIRCHRDIAIRFRSETALEFASSGGGTTSLGSKDR